MKKLVIEYDERLTDSTVEAIELTLHRLMLLGFVKAFSINMGSVVLEVKV